MEPGASPTPTTPLEDGESVIARFPADRGAYWRTNAWMAVFAMGAGMLTLWAVGNPYIWTGAVGGLVAIAIRALYLASDEVHMRWDLTERRLLGPGTRTIALDNIAAVNTIASAVQVVTVAGDKHLIKNQPDPAGAKQQIEDAQALVART